MRTGCLASRILLLSSLLHASCGPGPATVKDTMPVRTNRLAAETSPYLLQHAHNPVDWYPWGDEAFAAAKKDNKLVLVSIGYSTCHWCHVMERESFEDEEVARLMNEHFVCIKVDREVRPDVDQVYMTAVQLMTRRGGWPLNCFTLPDGRPVYGGTYFPKDQWTRVLEQLQRTWRKDPARMLDYAAKLQEGVAGSDLVELNTDPPAFTKKQVADLADRLEEHFDTAWGGPDRAPKFPMPNTYEFLLRYASLSGRRAIARQVRLTLDKMAQGGIFDQIGGGFARYSTDISWKVPHFEKMLYDNAQLISLYSHAFQVFQEPAYRDVVERTLAWARREMRSPDGLWYSALDADSEGEEGLYYLWTESELDSVLGADAAFAKAYYNVGGDGYWEEGRNILLRTMDDAGCAERLGLSPTELAAKRARVDALLLAARNKRVKPGLDNKVITSWNALMVTALCDAYDAFGNPDDLAQASGTMHALLGRCRRPDGGLWHLFMGNNASVNGYLDDYSFTAEALITLYQATFDETWLQEAQTLAGYAQAHFFDEASGMFFLASKLDPPLIARQMEVTDNVIPASNSSMAKVLFTLGSLLDDRRMLARSKQQLNNMLGGMAQYPEGHSNWAMLLMDHVYPWYEIAITGPDALRRRREFNRYYIPGRVFAGSAGHSDLPLLEDKFNDGATTIFVCENKVCRLPVATVDEALLQIR